MSEVVSNYLDLMDSQRESVFAVLDGITDAQLWERPAPKEWSIGEILNHNYLLIASVYPALQGMLKWLGWYGRMKRNRPYETSITDVYRDPKFPQWVGFIWTPRYNSRKSVSKEALKEEIRTLHTKVRSLYEGQDEDVLGNLYMYDPLFGWLNLIVALQVGVYHDQLHYDDVFKQAAAFQ